MSTLWFVLKFHLLMLFVFLPSIAIMLFAAFQTEGSFYFVALGLPALLINGLWAISKRGKTFISGRFNAIKGA